jgi:hypothetical protein
VAFYEDTLEPLDPEALVLVFYWNDLDLKTSWLDDDGVLRAQGWRATKKTCHPINRGILGLLPGKCFIDLHSAFYKAVKEYVNTRSAIEKRNVKREEVQSAPKGDSVTDTDLQRYEEELQHIADIAPEKRLFVIWPDSELHRETRPKIKAIAGSHGFVVLDLYEYFGNRMETLHWDYIHPSAASLERAASIIYDHLTP